MMKILYDTLLDRQDQLLSSIIRHLEISLLALVIAILIAVPLAIYLSYHRKIAEYVIQITAVLQTIPSLALLGLLIPLVGIGVLPATIALVIYALLPIIRNTYTGITSIDQNYLLASRALGMNSWQQLLKIQLPLASPFIMAGIRTAAVLIIGTATLASLIGAGGLGDLILLGIDRNDSALILLGAIPAALLAILFDFVLHRMEKMSLKKLTIMISLFLLIFAAIFSFSLIPGKQKEITIAGKLGAEPEILINMYQLLIEENTDIKVNLKPGMGKTTFLFNALEAGDIDIYPEFTGTVLETFLKENAISHDSKVVYRQAKEGIESKYEMTYLQPMLYNNTYAVAVSKSLADANGLVTISDLASRSSTAKAGFTLEFIDRLDGYIGLQETYGLDIADIQTLEPKLRYLAIGNDQVNVIDAYSTDSELAEYQLVVLEDDQQHFPPYQGAPLIRNEVLQEFPELEEILNQLANKITDDEMRAMNYQVNSEGKSAQVVARAYLIQQGLIK